MRTVKLSTPMRSLPALMHSSPLSAQRAGAWEDTVRYTSRLIMLEPGVSAQFYFYSAVGNHYLKNSALALEHAREASRLDAQHQNPKIDHLLGVLLAEKETTGRRPNTCAGISNECLQRRMRMPCGSSLRNWRSSRGE